MNTFIKVFDFFNEMEHLHPERTYSIEISSCLGKCRAFTLQNVMDDWQNQDKKNRDGHDSIDEFDAQPSGQDSLEIPKQDSVVDGTKFDRTEENSLFLRKLRQRHRFLQQEKHSLKRVLLIIDPQLDFHSFHDEKYEFHDGSLVSSMESGVVAYLNAFPSAGRTPCI